MPTLQRSLFDDEVTEPVELTLQDRLTARLEAAFPFLPLAQEYTHKLKMTTTPGGRVIPEITARARKPGDTPAPWPTPRAEDSESTGSHRGAADTLTSASRLTGWPTPVSQPAGGTPDDFLRRKTESVARGNSMGICLTDLAMVAQLTGYPTPNWHDGRRPGVDHSSTQGGNLSRDVPLMMGPEMSGWDSPQASDHEGSGLRSDGRPKLPGQAMLTDGCASSTPVNAMRTATVQCAASTSAIAHVPDRLRTDSSTGTDRMDYSLAGWASPTAMDGSRGVNPPRPHDTGIPLSQQVAGLETDLAGWGTPRVTTNNGIGSELRATDGLSRLEDQVMGTQLSSMASPAGWVTPSTRDWKDTAGMSDTGVNPDGSERSRMDQLPRQVHGLISESSPAATGSRAVLAPEFPAWLQGYPVEWNDHAPFSKEWDEVQRKLSECCGDPEAFSLWLAEIALDDSRA